MDLSISMEVSGCRHFLVALAQKFLICYLVISSFYPVSASNSTEPNGARDDGSNRFLQIRANQRQSYHDEGHSESVEIKRERDLSPDLEEQLFAPLTNEVRKVLKIQK